MSSHEPPISAVDAIKFAVDNIVGLELNEFLRMWLHGEWDEMRENWPEAFVTQALPDDHARAVAAVIADRYVNAMRLLLWVAAGVALVAAIGAYLLRGVL